MALKDWKLAYNINHHRKWYKQKNHAHEVEVKHWKSSNLWKWRHNDWSFGGKSGGRLVDTESQALALAKKYMRLH